MVSLLTLDVSSVDFIENIIYYYELLYLYV